MEVMSSLLLCALVCLLPQTLGSSRDGHGHMFSYNNTVLIQKNNIHRSKPNVMLNINQQKLNPNYQEQDVFQDKNCKKCLDCMERALKMYKIKRSSGKHIRSYLPDMKENELMSNTLERHRDRREADATVSIASTPITETTIKEKRTKLKKNKVHKSVTVTKFNINGEVYALKVKETSTPYLNVDHDNNSAKPGHSCRVFSVKKSYPCDSPEGYLILAASKTKLNKEVDETSSVGAATPSPDSRISSQTMFNRKRHIDNTQIPENVIPSMEEFY